MLFIVISYGLDLFLLFDRLLLIQLVYVIGVNLKIFIEIFMVLFERLDLCLDVDLILRLDK